MGNTKFEGGARAKLHSGSFSLPAYFLLLLVLIYLSHELLETSLEAHKPKFKSKDAKSGTCGLGCADCKSSRSHEPRLPVASISFTFVCRSLDSVATRGSCLACTRVFTPQSQGQLHRNSAGLAFGRCTRHTPSVSCKLCRQPSWRCSRQYSCPTPLVQACHVLSCEITHRITQYHAHRA